MGAFLSVLVAVTMPLDLGDSSSSRIVPACLEERGNAICTRWSWNGMNGCTLKIFRGKARLNQHFCLCDVRIVHDWLHLRKIGVKIWSNNHLSLAVRAQKKVNLICSLVIINGTNPSFHFFHLNFQPSLFLKMKLGLWMDGCKGILREFGWMGGDFLLSPSSMQCTKQTWGFSVSLRPLWSVSILFEV